MGSYKWFRKTQVIPQLGVDYNVWGIYNVWGDFDLGVYLVSVIILFLVIVLVVGVFQNINQ